MCLKLQGSKQHLNDSSTSHTVALAPKSCREADLLRRPEAALAAALPFADFPLLRFLRMESLSAASSQDLVALSGSGAMAAVVVPM